MTMTESTQPTLSAVASLVLVALGVWVAVMNASVLLPGAGSARRGAFVAGAVLILLVGAGATWRVISPVLEREAQERAIRQLVLDATAAEFDAYRHPAEDRRATLERYFAPDGARLRQIQLVRCIYAKKGERYADEASRGLVFVRIDIAPSGTEATVETREDLYVPLLLLGASGEGPLPGQTADDVNQRDQRQIYHVRLQDGRWLIEINPAPQRPDLAC